MDILVTLNAGYLKQLTVLMRSLAAVHTEQITLHLAHSSLTDAQIAAVSEAVPGIRIEPVRVEDAMPADVPVSGRYPREMYYRIFAARYLPQSLSRVLYLDPDIVVINPLTELYASELGDCYYAAASHVGKQFRFLNEVRLSMPQGSPYINSGVMLMNLDLLRRQQRPEDIFDYVKKHKNSLMLPDQDVISAVYGDRIREIEPLLYNLSERYFNLYNLNPENRDKLTLRWVEENTSIIHYCGRNKPWKDNYVGNFDMFYKRFEGEITGAQ